MSSSERPAFVGEQVAKLHEAALAQDPNIFAYDDFVEEKKVQAAHPQVQAPRAQGSKYIQTIMDSQEGRKQEDDIRYERKCAPPRTNGLGFPFVLSFAALNMK